MVFSVYPIGLLLVFAVVSIFFPPDGMSAPILVFLLIFLFLASRIIVLSVKSVSSELFAFGIPILAFFFLYSRGFVFSGILFLFGCFLFLPSVKSYIHFGSPRALLFLVFVLSLVLDSMAMNLDMVADYGWHLLFAQGFYASFPGVPDVIPYIREGMRFYYPPLSYFLLAALKHALPDLRLFYLGKLVMVFVASFLIFPVYLLTREVSGSRTAGIIAAFMFAVSPTKRLFYQFSSSLALPFLLFSIYFVLRSFKSNSYKDCLLGGVLLFLGFMNHVLPSLLIAVFLIALTLWHSYSIHRIHFSFVAVSAFFLFFVLAYFAGLYFAADFRPADIFERRITTLTTPVSKETLQFKYFLSDFPSLIAIGAVGIVRNLRQIKRYFSLYLLIFLTLLWILPPYVGVYMLSGPDRFAILLVVALSGFGGIFLGRSVLFQKKDNFLFIFLLFLLFVPNISNSMGQLRDTAISSSDEAAFNWMRENLETDAVIITDNGHSYWLPAIARRSVINGKKDDLVSGDRRDLDAALVFAESGVSRKVSLMSAYSARYVYFSNSTLRPFPYLTYEDVVSSVPSVGAWANVSAGLEPFGREPFRRIFFMNGTDTIAIYELNN